MRGNKNHKKKNVLLASSISVILAGCGSSMNCPGYNSSIPGALPSKANGKIHISIDGSGSMKGFAAANHSTFHRVIEELDDLLGIKPALGLPDSETNIFRIGREAKPSNKISKQKIDSLLAARQPRIFEPTAGDPWPKVSSTIDQFVSKDYNSIDILITDLEPDAASIKQIITAVKPKLEYNPNTKGWFKKKDSFVGNELILIGIKSQFNGGVFPAVEGAFPSFPYRGLRPFYLLILGPADKTELIVQRLSRLNIPKDQVLVSRFAANPAYGWTQFVDLSLTRIDPKNCYFPVHSISGGLSGRIKFDSAKKWLALSQSRMCQSDLAKVNLGIGENFGFGPETFTGKSYLSINNASFENSNLAEVGSNIGLAISTPQSSVGIIEASVKAGELDQKRWQSWNTTPSQPDGAKTQQLLRLITSLRDETNNFSKNSSELRMAYSPVRLCSAVKAN